MTTIPAPRLTLPELGPILSTCRTAITDQWDEDHEETIALVAQLDELLATQPDKIKVWAGAIDCKCGGTNLYTATTEAALYAQLAQFCIQFWHEIGDEPSPHSRMTNKAIVAKYFEVQSDRGDEWHVVEEVVLASEG